MANKMNFGVGINLYADKFRKGAKQVNSELKSIKIQVSTLSKALAALGAGASLKGILDTIRESAKLNTALKNVSGSALAFNQNMTYITGIANKYGASINTLTREYTSFIAAGKTSVLTLDQQKNLFEAIVQSMTSLGKSSDDMKGALLAVTQMMSKGKVQAEELRQQLGERLPGAFSIFAKSMGVSETQLNKLLDTGKVGIKELANFANELKVIYGNFDAESIEASINKINDAFTAFTRDENIQEFAKKFMAGVADAVKAGMENVSHLIILGLAYAATKGGKKFIDVFNGAIQETINSRTINFNNLRDNIEKGIKSLKGVKIDILDDSGLTPGTKQVDAFKHFSDQLKSIGKNGKSATMVLSDMKHELKLLRSDLILPGNPFNPIIEDINELERNLQSIYRINALERQATQGKGLRRVLAQVQLAAIKLGKVLKNIGKTILPIAIFQAIFEAFNWAKNLYNKIKEIQNLSKDVKTAIENATAVDGIKIAVEDKKKQLDIVDEKEQLKLLSQAEALLELETDITKTQKERLILINKALDERVNKNNNIAKGEAAILKLQELQTKEKELQAKLDEREQASRSRVVKLGGMIKGAWDSVLSPFGWDSKTLNTKELKEVRKTIKEIEDEYGSQMASTIKEEKIILSEFDEILQGHEESLKKLKLQYRNGAITIEKYNDSVRSLNDRTRESLGAIENLTDAQKAYIRSLINTEKAENKFKDVITKSQEELELLNLKHKEGFITTEEFTDQLNSLIDSTINQALATGKLNKEQIALLKNLKDTKVIMQELEELQDYQRSDKGRDKRYDYKLKPDEILKLDKEEGIRVLEDEIDDLMERYNNSTDKSERLMLDLGIKTKEIEIEGLKDQILVIDIQADITNLKKQLKDLKWDSFKTGYSTVKNFNSSISSLNDSFQRLKEIQDDDDATGIEKWMAYTNAIFSVIEAISGLTDGIMSMISLFKSITTTQTALTTATTTLGAVETTKAAATTTATIAETAAKIALAKANEYVAVTGAAASVASVPLVGAALAASAATSTKALLQSLQAFEKGGIVGGNSFSGDNVLARVNSGEMILNKGQQSTLFGMLNGKGGMGGNVEFKLKGSDLYGCFSNYNKKTSRY